MVLFVHSHSIYSLILENIGSVHSFINVFSLIVLTYMQNDMAVSALYIMIITSNLVIKL